MSITSKDPANNPKQSINCYAFVTVLISKIDIFITEIHMLNENLEKALMTEMIEPFVRLVAGIRHTWKRVKSLEGQIKE